MYTIVIEINFKEVKEKCHHLSERYKTCAMITESLTIYAN